jgi:hypothetical protein
MSVHKIKGISLVSVQRRVAATRSNVLRSSVILKSVICWGNSPTSLGEMPYTTVAEMPRRFLLCEIRHNKHLSGRNVTNFFERVSF